MERLAVRYLKRVAAVYVRWSTPEQVKNSEGSRAYQMRQAAFAEAAGFAAGSIVYFVDAGISGANPDRDGFVRMNQQIELGEIGGVFMFEVSRGARDEVQWFEFLGKLEKHDVPLFINGQRIDTSDEMQMVTTKIQSVLSVEESRRMVVRMHNGRLDKVAKYRKAVSAPPAGYVSVREMRDGEFVRTGTRVRDPDPAAQHGVIELFRTFRVERSVPRTVRSLRARGIRLPSRQGKRTVLKPATMWRVHRFLRHPAYAGLYIYGWKHYLRSLKGEEVRVRSNGVGRVVVIENFYADPYISMDEFEENQRILTSNRKKGRGRRPEDGSALLTRLVFCARHGAMQPSYGDKATAGRAYYRCMGELFRTGTGQCIQVPDAAIAPQIIATTLAQFEAPVVEAARNEWQRRRDECDRLPRLAARAVRRQEETVEHLYQQARTARDNGFGRASDFLQRKIEEELTELDRLQAAAKQAERRPDPFTEARWESVVTLCRDIRAIWTARTTTNVDRRELLALVIDRVVVEEAEPDRFMISTSFKDGGPILQFEWVRPCYWHRLMWTLDQGGLDAPAIVEKLANHGARNLLGNVWSLETVKKTLASMRKTDGPQPRTKRKRAAGEEGGPTCPRR